MWQQSARFSARESGTARMSAFGAGKGELGARAFRLVVGTCAAALGTFLVVRLSTWPPHEDEALALFVARDSLGDVLATVLGERGGAPLHFLLAHAVARAEGGLEELRLLSAVFAVASVPVAALLVSRLAGRTVAAVATALAAGSWMMLFHGVYGRMYTLFLFTSALSFLALVAALERGGALRWTAWGAATLAAVASHPYGALLLGAQGLFVALVRTRRRAALVAFAVVVSLAMPLWYADLVLAERFDVGVGSDEELAPLSELRYLRQAAADFSVAWGPALVVVLALAAVGLWQAARERQRAALLAALALGVPAVALSVAELSRSASLESRHLIFALPLFSMLVASGLLRLVARLPRFPAATAVLATAALVTLEVASAWHKTPALFTGETRQREAAREAAAAWIAARARRDDVLFGYEPLFLAASERSTEISETVVPRADGRLAREVLASAPRPLGRGMWVLDAGDTTNDRPREEVALRVPRPRADFQAGAFGPFLVVRTRTPTRTPRRYLERAASVMAMGTSLAVGDAGVNLHAVRVAARMLEDEQARR